MVFLLHLVDDVDGIARSHVELRSRGIDDIENDVA